MEKLMQDVVEKASQDNSLEEGPPKVATVKDSAATYVQSLQEDLKV
jgi:hypothetical protein